MVKIEQAFLGVNLDYSNYLIRGSLVRPESISLDLLCGEKRSILKTPVNGDISMVLRYKQKEGFVLSTEINEEDLNITQLQGAGGKVGYHLDSGFKISIFFADKLLQLGELSDCRRISMPTLYRIEGLQESTNETAVRRYRQLIARLGLELSTEENLLLRDIKRR